MVYEASITIINPEKNIEKNPRDIIIQSLYKRVNSRLEAVILRKSYLKGWSLAGIWKVEFQEYFQHSITEKSNSLGLSLLYKQHGLY